MDASPWTKLFGNVFERMKAHEKSSEETRVWG